MEMMINLCLNIVLFLCMAYLIFFKDYIKRKGNNLADKQDIADITHQIEITRKEFTHENERLKANLQLIISNQLQQSNEERSAIIAFFDHFSSWLNVGLLDTKINQYNTNNIENLYSKDSELNDFFTQTSVYQNRISLLVNNKDIVSLSHSLLSETLRFNHWTQKRLFNLRVILERQKRLNNRFIELLERKDLTTEAEQLAIEEKNLIGQKEELCRDYYKNRNLEHKKIIVASNEFTVIVKKYLNELGAFDSSFE